MTKPTTPARAAREILPPDIRQALIDAGRWPQHTRTARIEQLTDEAARRGLVMARSDTSMQTQWANARGAA